MVRRIGLASKAVHEWSGDFSRRAFMRCAGRARVSVHRSATRVELPFVTSTLRVVCSACPHPCEQNLWTSGMLFAGLARLPVACNAFKTSRIKHLPISCAGYSQACHQKLWTTSGGVRASEKRGQATRRRCIECNLNCVNDLRRSCSGYSRACHQKLWTRTQACARQKLSISE